MFVRVYSGDDGESHFEELDLPMEPPERTTMQAATDISFSRSEPGYSSDWHTAPQRRYVITLSGCLEIGIGDGTVRRFGPGDVLLAEDMTGRGHISRVVGSETRLSATILLA